MNFGMVVDLLSIVKSKFSFEKTISIIPKSFENEKSFPRCNIFNAGNIYF
jgi:hypothetical protein